MDKKIIVFGASSENYASIIAEYYTNSIAYCIDNDTNKHGTYSDVCHCEIYPIEKILEEPYGSFYIIIVATYYFNNMSAQLINMGFKRGKDFDWAGDIIPIEKINKYWDKRKKNFDNDIKTELNVLMIEFDGRCNLSCIYCPYHGVFAEKDMLRGQMPFDLLKRIVEELKYTDTITQLIPYVHGELFFNKNWYEYCEYVLDNIPSVQNIEAYTNGMLMDSENIIKLKKLKDRCDLRLVVSIDGRSPQEDMKFRKNSDYQIVKHNVQSAINVLGSQNVKITNNHFINKTRIENTNMILNDGSIPEYLCHDFNCNLFSKPTARIRTKENKLEIDNKTYKPFLIKRIDSPNKCWCIYNCLCVFSNGGLHICGCFNGSYLSNIANESLPHFFYENTDVKKMREIMDRGELPSACKLCPHNPSGDYFIWTEVQ